MTETVLCMCDLAPSIATALTVVILLSFFELPLSSTSLGSTGSSTSTSAGIGSSGCLTVRCKPLFKMFAWLLHSTAQV
jgi:hypothetical protein